MTTASPANAITVCIKLGVLLLFVVVALLVLALAAQVVVTAWRGALAAFDTTAFPSFMAPHPINLLFALVANATAVLSLIGILLAHRDEALASGARDTPGYPVLAAVIGGICRAAIKVSEKI